MKISIIVAMDEKRGIGKDNKIPWHIRDDLIKLKNLTKDHLVIVGRKTYDSMIFYYNRTGRPMPGKLYLVVTHDKSYKPARDNSTVTYSLEGALKIAKENYSGGDCEQSRKSKSGVIPSLPRPAKLGEVGIGNLDSRWSLPSSYIEGGNDNNDEEVFVIGGGQIFQQALSLADKLYLTIVEGDYNCDTFFPDYSEFKKVISEEKKESEGYKYKFLELERR